MVVFPVLVVVFLVRWLGSVSALVSHPESSIFMWWALPNKWKTNAAHRVFVAGYTIYSASMWSGLVFHCIAIFLYIETAKTALKDR